MLPSRSTGRSRAQTNAVNKQHGGIVIRSSQINAAVLTKAAVTGNVHARLAAQQVGDTHGVLAAQRGLVDHRDRREAIVGGARG